MHSSLILLIISYTYFVVPFSISIKFTRFYVHSSEFSSSQKKLNIAKRIEKKIQQTLYWTGYWVIMKKTSPIFFAFLLFCFKHDPMKLMKKNGCEIQKPALLVPIMLAYFWNKTLINLMLSLFVVPPLPITMVPI